MEQGLLVISGGMLQIPALETAKKMGLTTYLVDGSKNCAAKKYADHIFEISTKDFSAIADLAVKLKKQGKIHGVYTQGADVEYSVAYAAKKADLFGIKPQAALNCNNKIVMRRMLDKNGLKHVKFASAKTYDEFKKGIRRIGFPCYVKPVDNSASRGVTRLKKESDDLELAFKVALESCFLSKEIIIESEIQGEEFSVDTVIYKSKLYPAGISDRVFLKKQQYAVQIGSRTPSLLPEFVQKEMYLVMDKAAKALGVTDGAFKGDLAVDTQGKVRIVEVTARTSGGFDSQYRKPLSFGIDLMKATIDIALGKPLEPLDLIPKWVKWSSTTSVFAKPGKILKISGIKEVKKIPGVREIFMLVKEGDIIEPYIHSATRTNFVIISAATFEELLKLEQAVREKLIIKTKP